MDKIIIKTDKETIEMEVVLTYQMNNNNFVIYKDKKNVHYIAKYNLKNDDLDTDLTDEELAYGEKVLNGVLNEINNK